MIGNKSVLRETRTLLKSYVSVMMELMVVNVCVGRLFTRLARMKTVRFTNLNGGRGTSKVTICRWGHRFV